MIGIRLLMILWKKRQFERITDQQAKDYLIYTNNMCSIDRTVWRKVQNQKPSNEPEKTYPNNAKWYDYESIPEKTVAIQLRMHEHGVLQFACLLQKSE